MARRSKPLSADGTCRRCGTCCEKGGPTLHGSDRDLVDSGRIPLIHLFTLRPGETVRDNVRGRLIRAETDLIKIKGKEGSWCCFFFDTEKKACSIYEDRPLECRILHCQRPEVLEALYEHDRLSRKDLLASVEGLWDLVENHERRCSLETASKLMRSSEGRTDPEAREQMAFLLNYDAHVRRLVMEKGKLDPELLDFLFGRPLAKILFRPGERRT